MYINMDSNPEERTFSFGEKAVGITCNHAEGAVATNVHTAKQHYANIIDQLHGLRTPGQSESNRLLSIAITEAQSAQMWAVKAITWKD